MPDWKASMEQTFEYYIVDPNTWKDMKLINTVKSCNISRDAEADTRGSATINIVDSVGECYIRVYLITIQNGITEKHPLGTFLVQTPSSSYDGKIRNVSMDAYTPLIELKEKQPPLGYYAPKTEYHKVEVTDDGYIETDEKLDSVVGDVLQGATTSDGKQVFKQTLNGTDTHYCMSETIMSLVCRLARENARAPVLITDSIKPLNYDFISETDDTWFSFLTDLAANVSYEFDLDELGRICFMPVRDINLLRPVWTYDDDNSSILYPDMSMDHDLYGVPNVVEVVYSTSSDTIYSIVENWDENSPTSIPNRGRKIVYRVTDPELIDAPTQAQVDDYAVRLMCNMSSMEYTVTYSHGYCPVRVGDCVRLNYSRAGIKDIKAKVISQSITCETGCKVTEKAVFITNRIGRSKLYVNGVPSDGGDE